MPKDHFSKYVTDYAQWRSLTHFLAIPLLSPVSRPQFRNSIACLLDDRSAAAVPQHDIRPLGTLHLGLGPMSLTTPERFAKSAEILRTLNFKNILEVAAKALKEGVAFDAERLWQEASSLTVIPISSAPRSEVAPVSVSVYGLRCGKIGKEAETIQLSVNVADLTHRLKPFMDTIRYAYREAGLLDLKTNPDTESNRVQRHNEASFVFSTTVWRGTSQGSRHVPDRRYRDKLRRTPVTRYDSRDVINKYKDTMWSRDIRLDRVSICQMGLTHTIRRQGGGIDSDLALSEVYSVPLP